MIAVLFLKESNIVVLTKKAFDSSPSSLLDCGRTAEGARHSAISDLLDLKIKFS